MEYNVVWLCNVAFLLVLTCLYVRDSELLTVCDYVPRLRNRPDYITKLVSEMSRDCNTSFVLVQAAVKLYTHKEYRT